MSMDVTSLSNDVTLCHKIIAQQQETLEQLARQNQHLEHRLDQLLRRDESDDSEKALRGYLQADTFPGYDILFKKGDFIEVGCWAHARRKFFEAKETDLSRGMEAFARIRLLYDVEREAKEQAGEKASEERLAECRLSLRREKSKPLLDSFKIWLDEQVTSALPKSAIGQAIRYALSNWDTLCRYTEDGHIPLDNNAVERMLRIIALGRKNWRAPDVPSWTSRGSRARDALLAMFARTVAVCSATCI